MRIKGFLNSVIIRICKPNNDDASPAVVAWLSRSSTFSFSRSLSSRARWIESRSGNGVMILQTQKYVVAIPIAES